MAGSVVVVLVVLELELVTGLAGILLFLSLRLREASKIENRLNLGHCPNLPDLPPSPKTWDANFN